jgi:DNA-directed RNA polymerase specialized sigma24 family protein
MCRTETDEVTRKDRDEAMELLPAAYAEGLRMADAGSSREEIAAVPGIEVAGVEPLLLVGRAKLTSILHAEGD